MRSGGGENFTLTKVYLNEETTLDHRIASYRKDILEYSALSEGFHRSRECVTCIA